MFRNHSGKQCRRKEEGGEACGEHSIVSPWRADLMATAWNCQLPKVQRFFRAIWHHTGVCSHHSGSIASCTAQVSSISFIPLINIYQLPTGAGVGQWPGWLSWGFIKRCSKHGYIWDVHLHPYISPLVSLLESPFSIEGTKCGFFQKTHGRNLKYSNQIINISKEGEVDHSEAIFLAFFSFKGLCFFSVLVVYWWIKLNRTKRERSLNYKEQSVQQD